MIFKWYKTKKIELELKLAFLQAVNAVLNEQEDILKLTKKLYIALKDMSPDELQEKFASALLQGIHEQSVEESDNKKEN